MVHLNSSRCCGANTRPWKWDVGAALIPRPKQKSAYGGSEIDMADLAGAYAFGLAHNNPFVDGNKRTAAVISELFLNLNGHVLVASDMDLYPVCMAVASGELTEEGLARWLRDNIRPEEVSEERGSYA